MDVLQDRSPRLKAIVSAANDPWPMIAGEPDPKIVSAYFTHGIAVPPAYVTNLGGILDVASGYWEAWGGGRPNPQKTRAMDLVSGVEDLVRMLYLNSQTDHRPMEDLGQDLAAETLIQFSQANNIPLPV